jgi:hypothetical protein
VPDQPAIGLERSAKEMTFLVPVSLFSWPVIVLLLFSLLPPRRAVIVSMLAAWLFLPMAGYSLPGVPDITKMSITCVSVCLATTLFDPIRLYRLRWSWADIPMVVWLVIPLMSSMSVGLGAYDGLSGILDHVISWGLPYLIGRLYFSDYEGLRELALGVFLGGVVYLPFVLYELRMSPQLHRMVYGFHQHVFAQAMRGGGWRPTVFMQHGLAVSMFMGTASVCGIWLWYAGRMRSDWKMPILLLAVCVFAVTLACKSSYAMLLLLVGLMALFLSRWLSTRLIFWGLIAIAPLYVTARTVGGWDAGILRDTASVVAPHRLLSLEVRLESEESLWRWVQGRTLLGRARLAELMNADRGKYGTFIPDGLWLIALGKHGLVGLAAMFGLLLVPPILFLWRTGILQLRKPAVAGSLALMVVCVLYALDNLLNAMVNPIYLLAVGGLSVCSNDQPEEVWLVHGHSVTISHQSRV